MADDFKRKMRKLDSMQKHAAEQEFAGVRQWYYSLQVEDRRKLTQDLKSLAELADRLAMDWGLFLKANWSFEQYDDEGKSTFSIGATGKSAADWLHATDSWDETESISADIEEQS